MVGGNRYTSIMNQSQSLNSEITVTVYGISRYLIK